MTKFVSLRLRWVASSAFWLAALAIAAPSSAIASSDSSAAPRSAPATAVQTVIPLHMAQGAPDSVVQIEAIQATNDGFFIRTTGSAPIVEMLRQDDPERLTFIVENGVLSPQFSPAAQPQNINGVSQWTVTEREDGGLEITLELSVEEVTWQASASPLGGIVVIPVSGRSNIAEFQTTQPSGSAEDPERPAVIQSILVSSEGILQIDADQSLSYEESWDRATADYRIVIPNAQLASGVVSPSVPANSALLRVSVAQEGENVVLLVRPAAGVFVVGVAALSQQQLVLELDQAGRRVPLPRDSDVSTAPLPDVADENIVVVLDPGHGGTDPGAVGINGLSEIDIVFPMVLEVADILEEQGITAVLTRTDDRTVDLEPRVQTAERVNADLFVSIHANAISMSRPDVNGIETYYASDQGRPLAQSIQSSLIEATGMRDRGIKTARFYVIVNTSMPAVLVEVGFVTGAEDAPLLSDPEFRSVMAEAIARGILEHVERNF